MYKATCRRYPHARIYGAVQEVRLELVGLGSLSSYEYSHHGETYRRGNAKLGDVSLDYM